MFECWSVDSVYKKQLKMSTAKKNDIDLGKLDNFAEFTISKTNPDDGNYKNLRSKELLLDLKYTGEPRSISNIITDQQEFLSYIDYVDPSLDNRYIAVTNLDTSYSPKFVAYCLKTGKTCPMKVRKTRSGKSAIIYTTFKEKPFKNGDILYMKKCKQEPKVKLVDGEWIRDYANKEWWIYDYDLKGGN